MQSHRAKPKRGLSVYVHGWLRYGQHAVFPAAFALALLYFTVLGLDGITSSYIVSQVNTPLRLPQPPLTRPKYLSYDSKLANLAVRVGQGK